MYAPINHAQNAETPTTTKGIRDKVQRPTLVRPLWQRHWRPGPQRPFPAAAAAQLQPLLVIKPQQLLLVRLQPCSAPCKLDHIELGFSAMISLTGRSGRRTRDHVFCAGGARVPARRSLPSARGLPDAAP